MILLLCSVLAKSDRLLFRIFNVCGGDYVPKWLPKSASQLKTIMYDLGNGNFPFQNRKGCELGLYISTLTIKPPPPPPPPQHTEIINTG